MYNCTYIAKNMIDLEERFYYLFMYKYQFPAVPEITEETCYGGSPSPRRRSCH